MAPSRAVARSARTLSTRPVARRVRPYSSNASQSTDSTSSNSSSFSPALVGGLAGGALTFVGAYGWYHFSGAKTLVNTAHQTKAYFDSASKKFANSTPEPNEAIQWLREMAVSSAAFIPGAKGYVNAAFDELDEVRNKHGKEVDSIVKEAYDELKNVSKEKGMSVETAQSAYQILQKHLKRISDLAGDAASDIINKHPELKEKVGSNLDQLKSMGDKYGPEAKKQVEQTWEQIQDIVKSGVSVGTIPKIQQVVQEKLELVRKMGDEAWSKGMEQAKPYLDKSPQVKKLIEDNADALKQGNAVELWQKLKESGSDTGVMESYVKSAVEKAKSQGKGFGGCLDESFKKIPGADNIVPQLTKLYDVVQKHGKEAESLLKETVEEIQQVLKKKTGDAEKLTEKAKDSSTK